jgi:hypothetical protein
MTVCGMGSSGLAYRPVEGSCNHGNPSGSIKGGEVLDFLNDY